MVHEDTSGNWSLWAAYPRRLGGIAGLFGAEASADRGVSHLRRVGYVVETFMSWQEHSQRAMPGALAACPALLRYR
jgi:hypothetical protein